MAATTKEDLLAVSKKEFDKLARILEQIEADVALVKDADETSIKDIVGHRAHWIDLFFGWYEGGQAGVKVHFPAEGFKWNQLTQYNAHIRAQQSTLGWAEALSALHEAYEKLITFIEEKSDAELYRGPMAGANNDWTVGRWAEAVGPSHFRSASKYIRARRRNA